MHGPGTDSVGTPFRGGRELTVWSRRTIHGRSRHRFHRPIGLLEHVGREESPVALPTGGGFGQSGVVNFADHLRTWSAEALAELLSARPDLLAASDDGFEALARKASTASSLGRCLIRSDVAMFLVAQALAVSHPATADEIDELLGTNDVDAVLDALGRLAAHGIVVVEDRVASPLGALGDLLHRPLGLGPSFVELADHVDPAVLDELAGRLGADGAHKRSATTRAIARRLRSPEGLARALDGAPDQSRELLDMLVEQRSPAVGLPVGYLYKNLSDDDPLAWMLNHGLLIAISDILAELPREIVIGCSPDGLAPLAALRPIGPRPVNGLAAGSVAGAGGDAAGRMLEAAEVLLRLATDGEVAVRKMGGVGVREIRRLAKILELEDRQVGRLLELLFEAQLLNPRPGRLVATELAEAWWRLTRSRRWLVLVRAWVSSSGFLSTALSLDADSRPVPALSDTETVAAAFAGRQVVIDMVAMIPADQAFDPDQLAQAVVWRSPNLWGTGEPPPEELIDWTLAEAELLGLIAMNAPTPSLLALAGGDQAQLEAYAAEVLGIDQEQFVLQSDLTAVALGPLDPGVAGKLIDLADRQADSAIPQFRFSEASLRRGFDRGWTAAGITSFLSDHALSGMPQPLAYLLADVDRRYGSVKVLGAVSAIVADDEAMAVEIASTSRAARLGLRLIAPTVLIGPVEPQQLLDELRAEGFFPVFDGEIVRFEPAGGRFDPANDAGLPANWTGPVLSEAALPGEVADAVAALRAGDNVAITAPDAQLRLHLVWNRPAVVTHLRDGQLTQARGVVVAFDESLTLLNDTGVEELPMDAVIAIEDPSR